MSYKIEYTRHILKDSSSRITDPSVKTEEEIKKYYKELFCNIYTTMKYRWVKAKIYWERGRDKEWSNERHGKMVCGRHKFVFKQKWLLKHFVLITYMYKTETDTLEWNLLRTIRYRQWKN